MWHHFINLVKQSLYAMPSLISSNWPAVIMTAVIFLLAEGIRLWQHGFKEMKARWMREVGYGFIAVGLAWAALFLCSVAVTVYRDHVTLVGWVGVAQSENQRLWSKNAELRAENERLVDANEQLKSSLAQRPAARATMMQSQGQQQPTAPATLRVDSVPLPPAADGLLRMVLHMWTSVPVHHPTYLVVCDSPPAKLTVDGCGCGFMASSNPDVIGDITWNGEVIPKKRYLLFMVTNPDPVEPDYFISVETKSNDREYPRCQARLQPVTH